MSKKTPQTHRGKDIEGELYEAMRLVGLVLPQTVEDVIRAEQDFKQAGIELPPELSDPLEILTSAKRRAKTSGHLTSRQIEENLAVAARNGSEITPEIRHKM